MPRIDQRKETELLKRINDYQQVVRDMIDEDLRREREERHKHEEVFFMGIWVAASKVPKLQKLIARKSKVIFGETFMLICVLLLGTMGFWLFFKKLFLF